MAKGLPGNQSVNKIDHSINRTDCIERLRFMIQVESLGGGGFDMSSFPSKDDFTRQSRIDESAPLRSPRGFYFAASLFEGQFHLLQLFPELSVVFFFVLKEQIASV